MVDVTLVISSMQAEMSLLPNATVMSWKTAEQFSSFCAGEFRQYPHDASAGIPKLYTAEGEQSPALAYYSLLSDVGIGCGSAELASLPLQPGAFPSPSICSTSARALPSLSTWSGWMP